MRFPLSILLFCGLAFSGNALAIEAGCSNNATFESYLEKANFVILAEYDKERKAEKISDKILMRAVFPFKGEIYPRENFYLSVPKETSDVPNPPQPSKQQLKSLLILIATKDDEFNHKRAIKPFECMGMFAVTSMSIDQESALKRVVNYFLKR